MNEPHVTIHGAGQTVTGSCYEVRGAGSAVLVDCGLFQGSRTLERLNRDPFQFDPSTIDAVILTHAHLDHCGLLPRLCASGFKGPIWATAPTLQLLAPMLADAAKLAEQDAFRRNHRPDRARHAAISPLFTYEDVERVLDQIEPVALHESFEPAKGFGATLWNAGHILGSASVELSCMGSRLLFSGDLGPQNKRFEPVPEGGSGYDHIFCESTYGDHRRIERSPEQRRELLADEIKIARARGGNLIIPVFALERTQELLADIALLIESGAIADAQVFIDSPLATRVTRIFENNSACLDDISGSEPFRRFSFHYIEEVEDSQKLAKLSGAIILAGSGMCEGGRVRSHLVRNLPRPDSTILFVGFQAGGTLGRTILEGASHVRISGQDVSIRAHVRRIDCYSAHADQGELEAWVKARLPLTGTLFLTHGEPVAVAALGALLHHAVPSIRAPEIGETYALPSAKPARRLRTGRVDLSETANHDWQNDYADFALGLKRALERIADDRKKQVALARMRNVLADYDAVMSKRKARSPHVVHSL